MSSAAYRLWLSAGSPKIQGAEQVRGVCWWCGHGAAWTTARGELATFPDHHLARSPDSGRLCAACAWSMCETVAFPAAYGAARILGKIAKGGRLTASLRGAEPAGFLALPLASGRVGLWGQATAKQEAGWMAARESLAADPQSVGPCNYIGDCDPSELSAGETERMRCYHHFGGASLPWMPLAGTGPEMLEIRRILLSPPKEPYAAIIGNGKAHGIIYAEESPGAAYAYEQCVYVKDATATVWYAPERLAQQLHAYEHLVWCGFGDEEIASGHYARVATVPQIRAIGTAERTIAPLRGGPTFILLGRLCRSRAAIKEDTSLESYEVASPVFAEDRRLQPVAVDGSGYVPAPAGAGLPARDNARAVPVADRDGTAARPGAPKQLSLFGR